MDYARGQGIGWVIVLFYIFPVFIFYPISLIVSYIFKLPKLRLITTILSFPVLPLFIYYPISTLTHSIFNTIYPNYFLNDISYIFVNPTLIEWLFTFITFVIIWILIYLKHKQENDKFKKLLIIYAILFVLFIGFVIVDAFISKGAYLSITSM